jgi:hypothetical protein
MLAAAAEAASKAATKTGAVNLTMMKDLKVLKKGGDEII